MWEKTEVGLFMYNVGKIAVIGGGSWAYASHRMVYASR